MIAQSERLRLRRMAPADLPAFLAYRNDPDVARFQAWDQMDEAKAHGFLEAMSEAPLPTLGGWCQIGVAGAEDDQLIGDLGLHLSQAGDEAELGITLSQHAQRRGMGYEAVRLVTDWIFHATQAQSIIAITDARNHAAQALLDRLGWPRTETLGPEVEIVGLTEYLYRCPRPATGP